MSVNKYQPHILVLPEDDANRQSANGFVLDQSVATRNIQVLEEVGGWTEVLGRFSSDHVFGMNRYPHRYMILLIDFDADEQRLEYAKDKIPQHLLDRVFILGVLSEPEALRQADGSSYESIGLAIARDCHDGTDLIWGHALLLHNRPELNRLREPLRPILFPSRQY
jgi:hypothetical protein